MAVQIKGRKFSVSDQGLIALTLRYFCDSEDDAIFGIPPSYRGLVRRGHNGATWEPDDDHWIVDVTYQGLADGAEPGADLDDYEISGEFREEPIESFPDRAMLQRVYGAYIDASDGRLKFPELLPGGGKSATGLSGSRRSGEKNPFFGLTSYPVHYEVAAHTYVRPSVPASVHTRRGTIIGSLAPGFQYRGRSQTWFVDAPLLRKRGNAWTITERFKDLDALTHHAALMKLVRK